MTINDVIELLEAWTPTAYAEDFDNVGLLVGDKKNTISNILVSHDCLEGTVNEAISKDCNLIICFHPIIFSGLKRLTGSSYVERTVIKAIEHKIAIYALHTALDNVPYGVNHGMCNAIGLHNCKILIPKQQYLHKLTTYVPEKDAPKLRESLFNAGLGRIGNYDSCSFNVSGTGTFKPLEKSNPTLGSINELHQENEIQIHGVYEKHLESKVLNALLKNHPYEEVAYEITPLKNTHPHMGMGMIGQLGTPEDETSFLQRLKTVFGTESESFTKNIIAEYLTKKIRNKKKEITIEEKLRALYDLQLIDSRVDQIRNVRGELPLEVEDLEDEVAGLNKRIEKLDNELQLIEESIKAKKNQIEDSKAAIKKYTEQQKNVRNNREFNALSKEVEYQELEIQLAEKNIKEFKAQIEQKNEVIGKTNERLQEREVHLKHKKDELDAILAETEKEEKALLKKSEEFEKDIDDRLVQAYKRIRTNVRNGLAVVPIERGASGGSFFTIPPQVQMEIAGRKKIITDEHSGRILVDSELANEELEKMEKMFTSL